MSKISLTNLVNLQNETTAVNAINSNNSRIQTAINNTLSRDGTPPNQMLSSFDMNSNRILNLPSAISVTEPVTLAQMTAALVANGNINTGLTGVPVSVAMQPVVNSSTVDTARTLLHIPVPYIDATLSVYAGGVKADGVTDDTLALQAAIDAAVGKEVFLPAGTLVITSQIHSILSGPTSSIFGPGLKLRGSGEDKTYIDNRVANNSCFYVAGVSGICVQIGGYIKDLTIMTTTSPVSSHGIEHFACYQSGVENVRITGLTGEGLRITSTIGDLDACNMMWYRNCRVENCNMGYNSNFGFAITQPSFTRFDNCFFQNCVTGCRYIGLNGMMVNCAFTICPLAFWNPDNGGSSAQFTMLGTSFENNGVSIKLDALQGGDFIQTEFASSSLFPPISTQTVILNNATGCRFEGSRIRISSTPCTLWNLGTGATGNRISNSFYQNFDNAGQIRYSTTSSSFSNQLDDSFDSMQIGKTNGISGVTCVNGANQNVALPIDGAFFTLGGPSGAFSIGGLQNGFDGRQLVLYNSSGQTLTFNFEDAGSTAANRLRMENSANVTLSNLGCARFVYIMNDNRWHLLGKG